jgi:hypothetical protein
MFLKIFLFDELLPKLTPSFENHINPVYEATSPGTPPSWLPPRRSPSTVCAVGKTRYNNFE